MAVTRAARFFRNGTLWTGAVIAGTSRNDHDYD